MSVAQVVHSHPHRMWPMPVSGAGSNIAVGTLLVPGASGGTNFGVAIPGSATSGASGTRIIGLLDGLHNYSVSGDATTATLVNWYPQFCSPGASPVHGVELIDTAVMVAMDYSLVSTVAVASASTVTLTITSFEANYDSGFVYVNAGTGIGQLGFVASSSSGSCVLTSALTTQVDSTSKLTKIMPYFLDTPVFKIGTTTQPLILDSTAATGTGRGVCLGSFIDKNKNVQPLDPKAFHNMASLNSVTTLRFYSALQLVNTIFHPVS